MANDVEQLSLMSISEERELNACDAFGWTALMMAACEGAEEAVVWLLEQGAAVDVRDKSGQTALELARKKGHRNIVELLENLDKSEVQAPHEMESTEAALSPFYCELCQREYSESTWRDHQTSTVHRFNMKSLPPHRLHKFNISVRNRGLQLMVKQGWDREHGLGPQQNGRLYPVKTVLRKQRTGLGIQQPPARVTHFEAFDTNATKRRHGNPAPQHQERRTRNEMKREKLRDWRRERRLRQELSWLLLLMGETKLTFEMHWNVIVVEVKQYSNNWLNGPSNIRHRGMSLKSIIKLMLIVAGIVIALQYKLAKEYN